MDVRAALVNGGDLVECWPGLSVDVVGRIAALLGVPAATAPYRAGGETVYTLTMRSAALATDVTLLLWTGVHRADIRIGDCTMVFKRIDRVELYPGVEVLFRRLEPSGYLFLSVDGRASMVL